MTNPEVTEFNAALMHAIVQWVTRGVVLGQRRTFLVMQCDDWFAKSDTYGIPGSAVRVNATDVDVLARWIDR